MQNTNKRSGEEQFWIHENHAVELSNNGLNETWLNYIHENPVRVGIVKKLKIISTAVQEIMPKWYC